jgi:hypothetical protein
MEDLIIAGLPLAAACGVIVQIVKWFGMPTKWAALASIALGVVAMGIYVGWGLEPILLGIMAGSTAAGIYSGSKAIITKGK